MARYTQADWTVVAGLVLLLVVIVLMSTGQHIPPERFERMYPCLCFELDEDPVGIRA